MKKRTMLIFVISIIGVTILFNIYLYNSRLSVNSSIKVTNSITQSLSDISSIRIEINKASQAEKLYLLTLKDVYKSEYNFSLYKIYSSLDELYSDGIIDKFQFDELMSALDEYRSFNDTSIDSVKKVVSTEEAESMVLDANRSQIKLLRILDNQIDTSKETIYKQNSTIKDKTDIQVYNTQIVSTIITSIVSVFAYLLKKYSNSENIIKIIDCIEDLDDNKDNKKEDIIIDDNSKFDISLLNEKITQYEKMLDIINVFYKQNSKLECNLDKCEMIIKDLRKEIHKLTQESSTCSSYAQSIVDGMYEQLAELMIQFESLPIYDEFLSDLYDVINKK